MAAVGLSLPQSERLGSAAADSPVGPLRILLADDSSVNQKLVAGLLSGQGHSITTVANGREAVEMLQKEPFDLVLMDVQMPEMDGLQATAAIRAKEKETGQHVPIVAMTAHAMRGDRDCCLAAGMDAYLAKPIRGRSLAETIAAVMAGRTTSPPPTPGEPSQIDWAAAMEAVQGDPALLRAVAKAFRDEGPRLMAAILEAVQARDSVTLRRAAHTLKSSLHHFGVSRGYELALQLEQQAGESQFSGAEAIAAALQAELTKSLSALGQFLAEE